MVGGLKTFFRLIRIRNLFIVAATQLLLYYYWISPLCIEVELTLSTIQVALLVLDTMLIAAGGYIINDYQDQKIDNRNKPEQVIIGNHIPANKALRLYYIINLIGLLIALFLAAQTNRWLLFPLYPLAVGGLYAYAKHLKCSPFLGNLLVALFCAFVPGLLWIAEWSSWQLATEIYHSNPHPNTVFTGYLIFAALSTIARELAKDIEDWKGDGLENCQSTAVAWGIPFTLKLLTSINALLLLLFTGISLLFFVLNTYTAALFWLLFLAIPCGYISYQLLKMRHSAYQNESWPAYQQKAHRLSSIYKVIMIFGLIYLPLHLIFFSY